MRVSCKRLQLFLAIILSSFVFLVKAQDRFTSIKIKLEALAKESPGLNEKVELSANSIAIQEFIRGLAVANDLNISVDNDLTTKIINNFSNVTVADVLLFLCKKVMRHLITNILIFVVSFLFP